MVLEASVIRGHRFKSQPDNHPLFKVEYSVHVRIHTSISMGSRVKKRVKAYKYPKTLTISLNF